MSDIPLFDSLTHPTLDGRWLHPLEKPNTLVALEQEMVQANVRWALAVGMKDIGSYEEEAFAPMVKAASPSLVPVAWFEFTPQEGVKNLLSRLQTIKKLGYAGIKLHPRRAGFSLASPMLPVVLAQAAEAGLFAMLCTYLHGPECAAIGTSIRDLPGLLAATPPTCRLILLHGGTTDLLAVSEMVREHPNVLVDLSFTLCRYEGSSLDLDIAFLFQHFDLRLCVGSDSPQYSLGDLRRRFDAFAKNVSHEKASNIAHRNLMSFVSP